MLDDVAALVAKSLIRATDGVGADPRYGMLETIREYGLEQLAAVDEEAMRDRHAAWCLALAEQAEPTLFLRSDHGLWLNRLRLEHDNMRAVLAWLEEAGATETSLRLTGALVVLVSAWLLGAREASGWSALWREVPMCRASHGRERSAVWQRWRTSRGKTCVRCPSPRRGWRSGGRLRTRGAQGTPWPRGSGRGPGRLRRGAATLGRGADDLPGDGISSPRGPDQLPSRGRDPRTTDHALATSLLAETLSQSRELGDAWTTAIMLGHLGLIATEQGELLQAGDYYAESLALHREAGTKKGIVKSLAGLATLAVACQQLERAARLWRCICFARQSGLPLWTARAGNGERAIRDARTAVDASTFAAAWTTAGP